jgi:hypothetical protein
MQKYLLFLIACIHTTLMYAAEQGSLKPDGIFFDQGAVMISGRDCASDDEDEEFVEEGEKNTRLLKGVPYDKKRAVEEFSQECYKRRARPWETIIREHQLRWLMSNDHNGEVLKQCLEDELDPNTTLANGSPILHEFIKRNNTQAVKLLLEYNAHPNAPSDGLIISSLHHASSVAMQELLIAHKAGINELTYEQETPLHWAVAKVIDDAELALSLVENLIKRKAAISTQNIYCKTPLEIALALDKARREDIENKVKSSAATIGDCSAIIKLLQQQAKEAEPKVGLLGYVAQTAFSIASALMPASAKSS